MPIDRHQLREDLQALVGERHPLTSPSRLRQTEAYLHRRFSEAGLTVTTQSFPALSGTSHNVIGTVFPEREASPAAPPLILAAHFDTVEGSPGADDNASALAVILHVARQVRTMRLARPIRFIAFNLEEEDLLAKRAGIAHSLYPNPLAAELQPRAPPPWPALPSSPASFPDPP